MSGSSSRNVKAEQAEEEGTYSPLCYTYCINSPTHDIFKDEGFAKGNALLADDIREGVINYIKKHDLQR